MPATQTPQATDTIDRALAWAHGAEWISSPDLTEADVDTGR